MHDKLRSICLAAEESAGPDWSATLRATYVRDTPELSHIEITLERARPMDTATEAPPPDGPRPLLDRKEVAGLLKVSLRTVDTLVSEGALPSVRVRGQRRFTADGVDDYLRRTARGRGSSR